VAGTSNYKGQLAAGGQTLDLTMTRVVEEADGSWKATETAHLPMGDASDTITLDKATLAPTKRSVKQGPASVELVYAGNKVSGSMTTGDGARAIEADLGGPIYADGAAAQEALAALPLADGYQATFRNFDLRKQKPSLKQVRVVGKEEVVVPAGKFQAWKLEVSSAEGDPGQATIWVAADSRRVVKTVATLPDMGGATVTLELEP
jgi:hypothetical protein